jgi:hypothetical protein
MANRHFCLMAFQQKQFQNQWHFKASDPAWLAEDVIHFLLETDANSQAIFNAANYSQVESGKQPYRDIFFDFLKRIEQFSHQQTQTFTYYALYERTSKESRSPYVKLNHWEKREEKLIKHTNGFGNDLADVKDDHLLIKLWRNKMKLSAYRQEDCPSNLEWGHLAGMVSNLEKERLDKRLISTRQKPKIVQAYYDNDRLMYVRRRSGVHTQYEWLINAHEIQILFEKQKEAKLLEQALTSPNRESIKLNKNQTQTLKRLQKAEERRILHQELSTEKQVERDRLRKLAIDEFEKQKEADHAYAVACMYQANAWLHGHTENALRNQEAWDLAEKEDAEDATFLIDLQKWQQAEDPSV